MKLEKQESRGLALTDGTCRDNVEFYFWYEFNYDVLQELYLQIRLTLQEQ